MTSNLSNRGNGRAIVSFFDQHPEYNGVKFHFRGSDGYCKVSCLNEAMGGKRFNNWTRTQFAQTVIAEISRLTGIPVDWESQEGYSQMSTPLIDYDRASGGNVWIHPYLVTAYALQDPILYARVSIWLTDLMTIGTINPHILQWTQEEYMRGLEYNRDDIRNLYG